MLKFLRILTRMHDALLYFQYHREFILHLISNCLNIYIKALDLYFNNEQEIVEIAIKRC